MGTINNVGNLRNRRPPLLDGDLDADLGAYDPFARGLGMHKCPCAFHYPINNYLEFSQKSDSSEQEGFVGEESDRDEEQNDD